MNEIGKKLKNCLFGNPEIQLAFLFGSEAAGSPRTDSDVDIAVLYRPNQLPGSDALLELNDRLTALLKREVDLVVLNRASPIIRMQVLKHGKKIIEKDHRVYADFFVRTINEYDDLKRVRAVVEKNIMKGGIYG